MAESSTPFIYATPAIVAQESVEIEDDTLVTALMLRNCLTSRGVAERSICNDQLASNIARRSVGGKGEYLRVVNREPAILHRFSPAIFLEV